MNFSRLLAGDRPADGNAARPIGSQTRRHPLGRARGALVAFPAVSRNRDGAGTDDHRVSGGRGVTSVMLLVLDWWMVMLPSRVARMWRMMPALMVPDGTGQL